MPYAGFTSPDYVPPTGFLTLLTVCTSRRPPGLFHPGHAHGVPPSRAFPPRRAVTPLDARCRPVVRRSNLTRSEPASYPPSTMAENDRFTSPSPNQPESGPPSRLCSLRGSVANQRGLRPLEVRCSHGLSPRRGSTPPYLGRCLHRPPPMGFPRPPFHRPEGRRLVDRDTLRSIDRCEGWPLSLETGNPPMRFPTLSCCSKMHA
jgi:hypothetical protein